MKGKYLSPKADLTFKLVFAEHKDLMMSLLNALLPLAEDAPIVSIEYETPEMVPERDGGKNSVVDVRCKDARGRRFLVEMQMNWDEEFKKRVIMNASKAVIKQVGKAEALCVCGTAEVQAPQRDGEEDGGAMAALPDGDQRGYRRSTGRTVGERGDQQGPQHRGEIGDDRSPALCLRAFLGCRQQRARLVRRQIQGGQRGWPGRRHGERLGKRLGSKKS